jgi:hypothetical protein
LYICFNLTKIFNEGEKFLVLSIFKGFFGWGDTGAS